MVCFAPLPFLPVYLGANVGPQGLLAVALPAPFIPQSATSLDPALQVYLCVNVGPQGLIAVALPAPFVPQSTTSLDPATLPRVLCSQLPISAPPTGLDECFFFISLVVGLPCG